MNKPTDKEKANLQKLLDLSPIERGFDFLAKDNVEKTLVYFGDRYNVVGATKPNARASILLQRVSTNSLHSISANNWLDAAMREQLTFE